MQSSTAASRPNRLLRQPGGFEGLGPVRVNLHRGDLASAKRPHLRIRVKREFDAARPTPDALSNEVDDLIAGIDQLLMFVLDDLPRRNPFVQRGPHGIASSKALGEVWVPV